MSTAQFIALICAVFIAGSVRGEARVILGIVAVIVLVILAGVWMAAGLVVGVTELINLLRSAR